MSKHLKYRPKAPWHWDGQDPLDMDNRIVAQSLRAPVVRNVQIVVTGVDALGRTVSETIEPEGWDMDGLGR